jgi:hypothetical protein
VDVTSLHLSGQLNSRKWTDISLWPAHRGPQRSRPRSRLRCRVAWSLRCPGRSIRHLSRIGSCRTQGDVTPEIRLWAVFADAKTAEAADPAGSKLFLSGSCLPTNCRPYQLPLRPLVQAKIQYCFLYLFHSSAYVPSLIQLWAVLGKARGDTDRVPENS